MTVFKTFWCVLKKYKGTVLLYTIILLSFGIMNMQTSDNSINFENTKPNILIFNNDNKNKITDNLINYLSKNCNVKDIKDEKDNINDALFYREVNYVVYIPKNYGEDIVNKKNPKLDIKSTGDYGASLANMMLTKYIKIQNIYNTVGNGEEDLIKLINNNLDNTANVFITSKLDTNKINEMSFYFTFASYSILAVIILIICMVLNSFNETKIKRRTIISSMNYKKHNRYILIGSFVYSTLVWLIYSILGIFIVGTEIFTFRGFLMTFNLFIYSFCSLTMALLISTLINNKDAISGIVNVVALGSSFLCGAFVPVEWIPNGVLKFAHILPAYFYINTNEKLKFIEVLNFENLKPILWNYVILIIFALFYIILNNIIGKKKLKS